MPRNPPRHNLTRAEQVRQAQEAPPSPRLGSPKFQKTAQKQDLLAEEHHPYHGKPQPVPPPRIAGYSGHRPGAFEPVGLNFNRIEMCTNEDYAHGVTYESINNPAFCDRIQPISTAAKSVRRERPRRAQHATSAAAVPYPFPWQNPKNPITGTGWYAASGELPPPLHSSRRIVAPIGHPERYDFVRDDPPPGTSFPNSYSLFSPYCPFDLD